jgi:two-component sensor histidine kinase
MVADLIAVAIENNMLFEERREAGEQIRRSLAEKETLLRELYHRTKNNMQVIRSLLSLEAGPDPGPGVRELVSTMENRIQAMSLVHQRLYRSQDLSVIDLRSYAQDLVHLLLQSYSVVAERVEFSVEAPPIPVNIDVAMPCGLIINELVSNSLKYAFPENRSGGVSVVISQHESGEISLRIADNGVGVPPGFDFRAQQTLGLQMVFDLGECQLDGRVEFSNSNGVTCTVTFRPEEIEARV